MKKAIKYTKGEIGKVKIIKDFLPSPAELVAAPSNSSNAKPKNKA